MLGQFQLVQLLVVQSLDVDSYSPLKCSSSVRLKLMKTFQVRLSRFDNPDKLKFITVEECIDMDDCVNHIHSTEKEFIIDAIKEVR